MIVFAIELLIRNLYLPQSKNSRNNVSLDCGMGHSGAANSARPFGRIGFWAHRHRHEETPAQ